MPLGIVRTSILTDIANAIRQQAGVSTLYRPREMAAVVAALDGTWTLSAGATGHYAFGGCASLVGGAGTAYSAGATGCAMAVIDRAGQAGYLTEAT